MPQTAGVFYYMNEPDIWTMFVETSQHMESVLHQFDKSYPWGGSKDINKGELKKPDRGKGQPASGLRDLYCYWIEMTLGGIEARGSAWVQAARDAYLAKFPGTPATQVWTRDILAPGRYISREKMAFPSSRAGSASHGMPNENDPRIWVQSWYENLWKGGTGFGAAGPF